MKEIILNLLHFFIGNRLAWKLGRSLYIKARQETPLNMMANGERIVQKCFVKHVDKKSKVVLFDVGANVGNWTKMLLEEINQAGNKSLMEGHLFEPIEATFKTLESNLLNYKDVALNKMVVSSEEGTAQMYVQESKSGSNSLYNFFGNKTTEIVSVNKTTLHKYCVEKKIDKIHFLKIDTEGHDLKVLMGAKKLFEEERIMVCQFEYSYLWIHSHSFLKDVFDLLSGLPYKIGKITHNTVIFYHEWHPELDRFFAGNYLIVHNHCVNWFNGTLGGFGNDGIYRSFYK